MIRKVAGEIIVSFLRVLDPKNWTEALTLLVHSLDSPNLEEQEVSQYLITLNQYLKQKARVLLMPWRRRVKTFRENWMLR